MKKRRINFTFSLICLEVLFVPLYYFICEILLSGSQVDNSIRDIVILILIALTAKSRLKKNDLPICLSCTILMLFGLGSFILFSYPGTLNVLRSYLMPMVFYFVCRNYNFSEREYIILQRLIILELAVVGILGLYQAFFLGDSFLVELGYPSRDGFLDATSYYIGGFFGYQRNIASFVSPNTCGVVIATALIIHIIDSIKFIESRRWLVTFSLSVALLGTFSRSAIVGTAISVIFVNFIVKKWRIRISKKMIWVIPICLCSLGLVYFIDSLFLNGLFFKMLSSSFVGTINKTDLSALKHIEDLFLPMETILDNPFGLGFGSNGPMAIAVNTNAHAVESSIYLMMFEVGVIPAIIVFLPYVKLIVDTIRNKKYRFYAPAAIVTMVLITYLLLPNIQTYEVGFFAMMYIGFYYNESVRDFYVKKK